MVQSASCAPVEPTGCNLELSVAQWLGVDRDRGMAGACWLLVWHTHTRAHNHPHTCISSKHTQVIFCWGKAKLRATYYLRQMGTAEENRTKYNKTAARGVGGKSHFSVMLGTKCKPLCIPQKHPNTELCTLPAP